MFIYKNEPKNSSELEYNQHNLQQAKMQTQFVSWQNQRNGPTTVKVTLQLQKASCETSSTPAKSILYY